MRFFVCFILTVAGALFAQNRHYKYLKDLEEIEISNELVHKTEKLRAELDEYKKKMDSLIVRTGFKF